MELNNLINKIHKTIEAKEIIDISQKDMATRIGVAPRTYTEYTRGTNKPLAMKALLNMLNNLDDEDIVKIVRLWGKKINMTAPVSKTGNSILNKAKYSNNTDEWYTDYKTIEKEVIHYESQLNGKKILCNCDDPYESAFAKYFIRNFNKLKLKKLVCISYAKSVMHTNKDDKGLILVVENIPIGLDNTLSDEAISKYFQESKSIDKLKGDGDFKSKECLEYLIDSDIIVTNPPFSKFIELFSLVAKYNKKYLLISNQNAVTYKEIFPYIKNNLAFAGHHFGDMAFKVPADTEPRKTRFWIDDNGQKWRSLGNAMWLTNLRAVKDSKKLKLEHVYDKNKYSKYDNFDAIHLDRVADIPVDYDGIMGVPLTYLKYHNDDDFEIVGEANHGSDNEYDLFKPQINGKETFKRILIKRQKRQK